VSSPGLSSARWLRHSILPGFRWSLAFTLVYLGLVVLLPLSAVVLKTVGGGWDHAFRTLASPRVWSAFALSFGASGAAALVNVVFGLVVAWVLVRYEFPLKGAVDALVDLPFAMPTAVAGITLTGLYSPNGWLGRWLAPLGVNVAYSSLGITVALIFIGLPFVVRTVQPVLADLDADLEDAAASLGATRWQTWRLVVLPSITPALLTGFALAFARAVGEYGSVVFISGNMPMRTEVVPMLMLTKLEQYDYAGATALACLMLAVSFGLLLVINALQRWSASRGGA
jgi:sulfate transport system permease protein